jgi:hypothetical protein
MSEFKKVPIFIDENKINGLIQPQESRIAYFQELVNIFVNLNIDEPLEKTDLTALVENPKEFIAKKLIKEETLSIGGLKLNFEKMFDMIEKPKGTDDLINKIINDQQERVLLINQRNASYFEITPENEVILKTEYLEQTTEKCTVYITTENQQKAYNCLTEIAKNINELSKLKVHSTHFQEDFFKSYFDTDKRAETIAVNPYFGTLIR